MSNLLEMFAGRYNDLKRMLVETETLFPENTGLLMYFLQ